MLQLKPQLNQSATPEPPATPSALLRFRRWRTMRRRAIIEELHELEDGMIEDGELKRRTIERRER